MRQYSPSVRVIYHNLISGTGAGDITHWFGDGCTIHTSKGVFEPAGNWSITFLDKQMGGDSVYARLSPMDAIDIQVSHDGRSAPKTIMRGFVSSVSRSESIGGDGKPARRVTISGQDVGKLWITLSLYINILADDGRDASKILQGLGPVSKFIGESTKNMSGANLLTEFTKLMHSDLQKMLASSSLDISLVAQPEGEGDVPYQLMQSMRDITYYQFLQHCLDAGVLYELWIDDPGDGDAIVRWREMWSGEEGSFYNEDQIQTANVSRDDSRVSNWFWYWPRTAAMLDAKDVQLEARRVGKGPQDATDYQWCAEKFFGFRKLSVEGSLLPPGWATNADEKSKAANIGGRDSFTDWVAKQTEKLKDMNKDNVRLENCVFRICGDESVRPGKWYTFSKNGVPYRYYAVSVEHEFNFWGGFFTTIHGMRGEKWSGQGSYFSELNLSGATR